MSTVCFEPGARGRTCRQIKGNRRCAESISNGTAYKSKEECLGAVSPPRAPERAVAPRYQISIEALEEEARMREYAALMTRFVPIPDSEIDPWFLEDLEAERRNVR